MSPPAAKSRLSWPHKCRRGNDLTGSPSSGLPAEERQHVGAAGLEGVRPAGPPCLHHLGPAPAARLDPRCAGLEDLAGIEAPGDDRRAYADEHLDLSVRGGEQGRDEVSFLLE